MKNLDERTRAQIKVFETFVTNLTKALAEMPKFAVGDYLVAYEDRYNHLSNKEERVLKANHFDLPRKFIVVHVDQTGSSWVQELNKAGKPSGRVIRQMEFTYDDPSNYDDVEDDVSWITVNTDYIFELDPDYADAVILEETHIYDPMAISRNKKELQEEIKAHNAAIKISLNDHQEAVDFMATLKVGDVLWRSEQTSFSITEIAPNYILKNGKLNGDIKYLFKGITNAGKEVKCNYISYYHGDFILRKAIYTAQPRSFAKTKKMM